MPLRLCRFCEPQVIDGVRVVERLQPLGHVHHVVGRHRGKSARHGQALLPFGAISRDEPRTTGIVRRRDGIAQKVGRTEPVRDNDEHSPTHPQPIGTVLVIKKGVAFRLIETDAKSLNTLPGSSNACSRRSSETSQVSFLWTVFIWQPRAPKSRRHSYSGFIHIDTWTQRDLEAAGRDILRGRPVDALGQNNSRVGVLVEKEDVLCKG